MVQQLRSAWPDDALDATNATEIAKLFRAYDTATVTQVIADRVEAELPMPGRGNDGRRDLSRILKSYSPSIKADTDPTPPRRPENPWVRDMADLPKPPPELELHMAEMRDSLAVGTGLFDQRPRTAPEPPVIEFTVIPPSVREALQQGIEAGAKARSHRRLTGEAS